MSHLRKNGDSSFTLLVVAVHHTNPHLGVSTRAGPTRTQQHNNKNKSERKKEEHERKKRVRFLGSHIEKPLVVEGKVSRVLGFIGVTDRRSWCAGSGVLVGESARGAMW